MTVTSSVERTAAFADAGLPVPIYADATSTTSQHRTWSSAIGSATHAAIAHVAAEAQQVSPQTRSALLHDIVPTLVNDQRFGRLDRARLRVTSLATAYLTGYLPAPPAAFLGAEVRVAGGRVDLAWQREGIGAWFDEIKTWRTVPACLDEKTTSQIGRYLAGGQAMFGSSFAGVRLLLLGNSSSCLWVSPVGDVTTLVGSPLRPALLASEGVAS